MEINTNNHLKKIYNGNQTIMNAGFTMKSNYIVPILSRMVDEDMINISGSTVVQTILQYKHNENNPFPSNAEIARVLGKSLSYVQKAVKSIKKSGILSVLKNGRKSVYSFKPFFSLLEKFIVEYKEKKNYAVKIADLFKLIDVETEYKEPESEDIQNEGAEETVSEITLPESIQDIINTYKINKKGIDAIEKAYSAYGDKIDVTIFIEKIIASSGKTNFVDYFNKCITNAHINVEKPKKSEPKKASKPAYAKKPASTEIVPDWFEDRDKPKKYKTNAEVYAESSVDELLETKKELSMFLESDMMKGNLSMQRCMKQVNAKLENMDMTAEELAEITL